jgi:lipopolysaccharide heptosyltransferase I
VVRLSAIGDVIHGLPVLSALRERFPDARLAWVVEEPAAELLEGHPALDELITVPRKWLKSPRNLLGLRRRLRALRVDIALDLQGLSKSAAAAWLSGAPRRIGFGDPYGRELSQWLNTHRVRPQATHVIDAYLELLRPLGIDSPSVRFEIPENESDRTAAEETIEEARSSDGFYVVNPGAGWPSKRWPPGRYVAVIRRLAHRFGLPALVIWAGRQGRVWADRIVGDSDGHARLARPMSLRTLAAVTRRARLYLGSDSGPLHLAVAVGTPCVGLYGPWPAERHGPYGPPHVAIQRKICQGSTRKRRNASSEFMEAIDVPSVFEACDRLLRRNTSHAA